MFPENKPSIQIMKSLTFANLDNSNNNIKDNKNLKSFKAFNENIEKINKKDNLIVPQSGKNGKKVKYKLNIPTIKTENNNPSSQNKRLYDEEVSLIIKKKILYYTIIK